LITLSSFIDELLTLDFYISNSKFYKFNSLKWPKQKQLLSVNPVEQKVQNGKENVLHVIHGIHL
jgi:hypothetical protein